MRIIIDIDEDTWMNAWGDWDDALPEDKRYPAKTGTLRWFGQGVRGALVDALSLKGVDPKGVENIRLIEDPSALDDDEETGDE